MPFTLDSKGNTTIEVDSLSASAYGGSNIRYTYNGRTNTFMYLRYGQSKTNDWESGWIPIGAETSENITTLVIVYSDLTDTITDTIYPNYQAIDFAADTGLLIGLHGHDGTYNTVHQENGWVDKNTSRYYFKSNEKNKIDQFMSKFSYIFEPNAGLQSVSITPSETMVNEGEILTAAVATTYVESGTTLYYSFSGSGITTADFSAGTVTGSGAVGTDGKLSISHTIANDLTTEGIEILNIKLFSDAARTTQVGSTASVSITDISVGLTYYNPITNKNLNTWNAYQVTNSVKAGDIVSQWFGTAAPATTQLQDISETKLMDVVASTWSDKVKINRVVKATDAGGKIEAKQIDFAAGEVAGSVVSGGKGDDEIKGFAGWDNLEGGDGNDFIRAGNGRDIISGGAGRDELHGDFGWNTYRSEKDGVSDLIAIKSDHYLVNWIYGKAGNSPNGEKSDIIEGLDAIDKIRIIGVDTSEITFVANVATKGVTGIGIYGKGILEALYTGGDLTVAQITQMTSGDASAAAMSNSIHAYGVW